MMDKNATWKWLILVVLVSLSLWVATPLKEKIKLGLDLQGGSSFVVRIDKEQLKRDVRSRNDSLEEIKIEQKVKTVLGGATESALDVLRNRIDSLGISEAAIFSEGERIVIQLPGIDEGKQEEAEKMILSAAYLEFRLVHKDNAELSAKILKKKLVPAGYRMSDDGKYYTRDPDYDVSKMNKEYYQRLTRFATDQVRDPGYDFMLEKRDRDGLVYYIPVFVKRRPEMKGDILDTAGVSFGPMNTPVVNLEFNNDGKKDFGKITSYYGPKGTMNPSEDGRQLAIVLDGTLYSAPFINEPILSGRAEIKGSFSVREAMLLANILQSGALPAPLEIIEKRFVAPSLGEASVKSGKKAIIFGGIGVLAFMLVYYLVCGVIADLALLLNMILLPIGMIAAAGFLSLGLKGAVTGNRIQLPVLTLPGIAGILLTIGMAVDANVLIFERIREEFRTGKKFWTAITAGYDRAFVTIMDANVTTLLTGAILFRFGSGPIRGFAVTLCAGIVISMFTALVVTKLFFGVLSSMSGLQTLTMLSVVKRTSIDFIGKRKIAAVLSAVLIAASVGLAVNSAVKNPASIFGVDFMGGTSLTFDCEKEAEIDAVRDALVGAGIEDAAVQYQREMEQGGDSFLLVKTSARDIAGRKPSAIAMEALQKSFSEAGFVLSQEDEVGSQIGRELQKDAILSIVLALLGIVIYISWRFEFGFALGAIVALTHDVLLTAGIYTFCGRQISLPIVAALLTIVGYSVNDTIVVFDRIREDLKLVRNKSFQEICNLSINETLSRTLLTSVTTLITVVMLLVFGGGPINDFALTLFIGVLVGTYSSIFVATPVVLLWHRNKRPEFAATVK